MQRIEQTVVVIGKESVGKSQLVASLSGALPYVSSFRGSTVACEAYPASGRLFVDTPGIVRLSDTETTRAALERLEASDTVVLVAQATHLDDDLGDLLPLVRGKRGLVVVTFWDKVDASARAVEALDRLSRDAGVAFLAVDARRLADAERARIVDALERPAAFPEAPPVERAGWRVEPRPTVLEHRYLGPLAAGLLLLLPAIAAVWMANHVAELVDPLVQAAVASAVPYLASLPSLPAEVLAGRYGLVTMGPLLFVWAVPTVLLYALLLGAYKASGLVERITVALHPILRPFGLSGRDLTRVIMGFGCNVPAVVSTRSCSSCSRGTCVSAIAFGSACSYQLGATLGVFAAAGKAWLAGPYLAYLAVTTLVYARFTAPARARSRLNVLRIEDRTFLEWPRRSAVWREARGTLAEFFRKAIPVFLVITVIASVLDWLGVIAALAGVLGPAMAAFRLPAGASLPVLMASIRKDGILLLAEPGAVAGLSALQVVTGAYLAGVLLPCLVTTMTIAREQSPRFASGLLVRQAVAAVLFTLLLAWGGAALGL